VQAETRDDWQQRSGRDRNSSRIVERGGRQERDRGGRGGEGSLCGSKDIHVGDPCKDVKDRSMPESMKWDI